MDLKFGLTRWLAFGEMDDIRGRLQYLDNYNNAAKICIIQLTLQPSKSVKYTKNLKSAIEILFSHFSKKSISWITI